MSRRNLPPYRRAYRVMRHSANTATEACRHRWEWRALVCAWWEMRRCPVGVHYVVFPAVTA